MNQRWIAGLVLAAACGGTAAGGSAEPAESARESVQEFMQAAADSNLQRMGQLWGTARGPAAVTNQPNGYERRLVIMQTYLRGSEYAVTADHAGDTPDRRIVDVRLQRDGCTFVLPITTVRSQNHGWLVNSFDLREAGTPGRGCTAPGDSLPSAQN